jgi:hypothetical protein
VGQNIYNDSGTIAMNKLTSLINLSRGESNRKPKAALARMSFINFTMI